MFNFLAVVHRRLSKQSGRQWSVDEAPPCVDTSVTVAERCQLSASQINTRYLFNPPPRTIFAFSLNYHYSLFSPPTCIPQRRLNVDCYNISPDLNFILLYECQHDDSNGTKYYVYEIFSTTIYALTPNDSEEVELQKILWSPASYDSSIVNSNNNSQKKVLPSSKSKVKTIEKSKIAQAVAFIHDFDIYYKPKIHSDLVIRVTSNGEFCMMFKLVQLLLRHRINSYQL